MKIILLPFFLLTILASCVNKNKSGQLVGVEQPPYPPDLTFVQGGKISFQTSDSRDVKPYTMQALNFYMGTYEESNFQYRNYLEGIKQDSSAEFYYYALPDTMVWQREFKNTKYNEPIFRNYFRNPAFDQYPVVGVTWMQAVDYCQWKSLYLNIALAKKKDKNFSYYHGMPNPPFVLPDYRLPSESEWEYAAALHNAVEKTKKMKGIKNFPGPSGKSFFPKYKNLSSNADSDVLKSIHLNAVNDRDQNIAGLFGMNDGIGEWTHDSYSLDNIDELDLQSRTYGVYGEPMDLERVVAGGSWKKTGNELSKKGISQLMIFRRMSAPIDSAAATIGFRCAMSASEETKY